MFMTRRMRRVPGAVALLLLAFGSARGLAGPMPCHRHAAQAHPAGPAAMAGATAAHQHHGMGAPAGAKPSGDTHPAQDHPPCRCDDQCPCCLVGVLPAARAAAVVPVAGLAAAAPPGPAPIPVTAWDPHRHPFATAPPATLPSGTSPTNVG